MPESVDEIGFTCYGCGRTHCCPNCGSNHAEHQLSGGFVTFGIECMKCGCVWSEGGEIIENPNPTLGV